MKVAFHTLGCKVNQYETESIKQAFLRRGAEIVDENLPADVYIINTCTVTNIADRKSRQYIRRIKSKNPDAVMVATGCYVQVAAEEIEDMEEIDLVVGNNLKSLICDKVYEFIISKDSCARKDVLSYHEMSLYENMDIPVSRDLSKVRAYIKIQEGCNRFCSYCIIPYARGGVRSRNIDEIVDEAEDLIKNGFKEIVLTGINTALYGEEKTFSFAENSDEFGLTPLEILIRRLDRLAGNFRIRLSSLEPTVVDMSNVEKLLGYDKLCHHLHLSAQSGSDKILKLMNRHYTRTDYLEIVNALKSFDPNYGITTDMIVGFPGETTFDFNDTVRLVKEVEFCRVHVFRYSSRKGTRAAEMPDKISGKEKNARMKELMSISEFAAERFVDKCRGQSHTVLTEERSGDYLIGYSDNYIRVYIYDPGRKMKLSEFYNVKLDTAYEDGYKGII